MWSVPSISVAVLEYTEVRFTSFLSGGFITAIVANSPERKLAKRTSVQYLEKPGSNRVNINIEIYNQVC